MLFEWTFEDHIQEELLKDSGTELICSWLKENAPEEPFHYSWFPKRKNSFFNFREKYEPIWLARNDSKLTMSICLYGRDFATLRSIFFGDLPTHFKVAVARNPFFAERAGLADYHKGESCLTSTDILDLYNMPDLILFWHFIENPGIEPELLSRIFSRTPPYDQINELTLHGIFEALMVGDRNFFSRYGKIYIDELADLARAIIKLIPTLVNVEKKIHYPEISLQYIRDFLLETRHLSTGGFDDEETLALFNLPEPGTSYDSSVEKNCSFIQNELADRSVWRNPKKILHKFSQSPHKSVRAIHYKRSPLQNIYGTDNELLFYRFFETFDEACMSYYFDRWVGDNYKQCQPPKLAPVHQHMAESLVQALEKDGDLFAKSLAMNGRHYTDMGRRRLLKEICKIGDFIADHYDWGVCEDSCEEIFKTKMESLKQTNPSYFDDEPTEFHQITTKLADLEAEIIELKRSNPTK